MKSVVITEFGSAKVLSLESRESLCPQDSEVVIDVKAAGVNRADIMQRLGQYPAPPGVPADVPGLEVAGVISAIGKGVTSFRVGDSVCALLSGGGYSEQAVAHARECLPIPKNLSFIEAACLPEAICTVWHNVFELGALQAGETLLVHGGSSGIGVHAIMLASALGSSVIVTVGSREKGEACLKLGAKKYILYKEEKFEDVLKDEQVNVVLDMVGGDYLMRNLKIIATGGRIVHINAMNGRKAEVDILQIMKKRVTITGSTIRARDHQFKADLIQAIFKNVWPLIEAGKVHPIINADFTLAQASLAHELMESGQHIGKIVLTND